MFMKSYEMNEKIGQSLSSKVITIQIKTNSVTDK